MALTQTLAILNRVQQARDLFRRQTDDRLFVDLGRRKQLCRICLHKFVLIQVLIHRAQAGDFARLAALTVFVFQFLGCTVCFNLLVVGRIDLDVVPEVFHIYLQILVRERAQHGWRDLVHSIAIEVPVFLDQVGEKDAGVNAVIESRERCQHICLRADKIDKPEGHVLADLADALCVF